MDTVARTPFRLMKHHKPIVNVISFKIGVPWVLES